MTDSARNAILPSPTVQAGKAAPEFVTVGVVSTAFLAGSVKGGGHDCAGPKKQLKNHLCSFRVFAIKPNSKENAQMASANTVFKGYSRKVRTCRSILCPGQKRYADMLYG